MKAISVTIDPLPETENLISYVQTMVAPVVVKQQLLTTLIEAKAAYQDGRPILGNIQLETFKIRVQINRKEISQQALLALQDELKDVQDCLK